MAVEELKQLLEKRATFTRGVRCLAAAVSGDSLPTLLPLVQRTYTLLKTRYTSLDAWRAGQQLFAACVAQGSQLNADQVSTLSSYLAAAQQVVDEEDQEEAPAAPVQQQAGPLHPVDLLHGLGPSQGPSVTHFDDAGPIVDDQVRLARAQRSGTPLADGEGSQQPAAPASTTQGELQRQILQGIEAVYAGMAAVTRGTEAIEAELEQVLSTFRGRQQASSERQAPPMSKKVFNALPVIELDGAKVAELGPDYRCPVCTDPLQVGDKVFMLPCKGCHWYHPACVKPWLSKTNSCPVCREELPTDDPHYEAHKEQQAEAAAEQAGAAAALSHNEFMYI